VACATPAAAERLSAGSPLAPNEVLLETGGGAVVRSPATRATMTISVHVSDMDGAAGQAVALAVERVRAAARSAGARPQDIDVSTHSSRGVGMEAAPHADLRVVDVDESGGFASARVAIVLDQPRNAAALAATVEEIDGVVGAETTYSIPDRAPSRRAARERAIQNARFNAESYAAAMNMRVVRLLRVSDLERTHNDPFGMLDAADVRAVLLRNSGDGTGGGDPEVASFAVVAVDFALAPR